jgi:hypothetical protein
MINPLNVIDIIVIAIDIAFLCLPSSPSSADSGGGNSSSKNNSAKFTKTLRLVRLVRLIRLFKAAKIAATLGDMIKTKIDSWSTPIRYAKTPVYEIHTMVECIEVLLFVQKLIEDRYLSIFLRGFFEWESGRDTRSPSSIFDNIITDVNEISLASSENLNSILIDLIMYTDNTLVQGVLDVIVAHYSIRKTLKSNADNVQLLVSPRRERQFKLIDQMLMQLERNAETQVLITSHRSKPYLPIAHSHRLYDIYMCVFVSVIMILS